MCRHERVALLRVLVLPGRRPLRPAQDCVHRSRAPIDDTSGTRSISPSRPGRFIPFGAFAFQGVSMTTKLAALTVVLLAQIAVPSLAGAQSISGVWDAT